MAACSRPLTCWASCRAKSATLQAAASRLLFSFGRDGMLPASRWLSEMSPRNKVPNNALIMACSIPATIAVLV